MTRLPLFARAGADAPPVREALGGVSQRPDGIGDAIADAAAPLLLRAFGPERLLWGSDWPPAQFEYAEEYADARAQLDRSVKDPAARRTVLETTPAALFSFPRAATVVRCSLP